MPSLFGELLAHGDCPLLPVCGQIKAWGKLCDVSWDTALASGGEHVFEETCRSHLSLTCICPQAMRCWEMVFILITSLARTRRQMDVPLRCAAQVAQSLGCHSSLSGSPVTMTTPLM